ncbi:MAG: helix-turn-helix domain-containing protein [bacterium]
MISKQIGKKLKKVRLELDLTLKQAAEKLGYENYQTLSKIESGDRGLKATEIFKFSKVYFMDVSELLSEEFTEKKEMILWRGEPKQKEKKEIENNIRYKAKYYNLFEELLGIEKNKDYFFNINKNHIRNKNDLEKLARKTRDLLSLGNRPALSLKEILEQDKGVKILYESLPEGSAMTIKSDEYGFVIVINADEAPWRRNYDLAHEFFHLLTWNIIKVDELIKDREYLAAIEKMADQFASSLLLPKEEIEIRLRNIAKNQNNSLSLSDIIDISLDFNISTQALLYRMIYLEYLSWEKVQDIINSKEFKEQNKKLRWDKWGNKPRSDRFIELAVKCLRKGLISRGKFADLMKIDRIDIDNYINNLGLMDNEGQTIEIMAT